MKGRQDHRREGARRTAWHSPLCVAVDGKPARRKNGWVGRGVPVLTALPTGPCCLEISQAIADLPPLPFAHIVRL